MKRTYTPPCIFEVEVENENMLCASVNANTNHPDMPVGSIVFETKRGGWYMQSWTDTEDNENEE